MIRIDDRTVELTDEEQEASRLFDTLLDTGMDCVEAGVQVELRYPSLDRDFIDWLVF